MDDLALSIEKQLQQNADQQGDGIFEMDAALKPVSSSQSHIILGETGNKSCCGKGLLHWLLMILSGLSYIVGISSASLLGRLYFVHGGSSRWLYTWIQSVGCPILLLPLFFCYWRQSVRPKTFTPKLLIIYSALGCVTAFDNFLYSMGISYLPVSTNALICSSQLAFNAVFAYLLVRQKISPYVLNSVVIITTGTVLLGLHSNTDRPKGTTKRQYITGFVVTIAASAILALLLSLMELMYRRVIGKGSFVLVLEMQIGISIAATMFSAIGMLVDGSFAAMRKEALHFDLGSTVYSMTLLWSAIGWQLCLVGASGIIFLSSALMSCVFMTALLPLLPLLAVIFFHDSFSALKAIAMVLTIWGFISYIYGGYVTSKASIIHEETDV